MEYLFVLLPFPTCHLDMPFFRIALKWSLCDRLLGRNPGFPKLTFVFLGLLFCFAKAKSVWEVIFLKTCMSENVFIPNI